MFDDDEEFDDLGLDIKNIKELDYLEEDDIEEDDDKKNERLSLTEGIKEEIEIEEEKEHEKKYKVPKPTIRNIYEEEYENSKLYKIGFFLVNNRLRVFCNSLIFVFFVLFLVSFIVAVIFQIKQVRNNDVNNILNTVEYQIQLYPKFVAPDRDTYIRAFISDFNEYAGTDIQYHLSDVNLRTQSEIETSACGKNLDLRLRSYIDGPDKGKSTLDIKKGEVAIYAIAKRIEYQPSEEYALNSFDKIETDIHPCSTKYSRECRVEINTFQPLFKHCKDVIDIFPSAFNFPTDISERPISQTTPRSWYQYKKKDSVKIDGTSVDFDIEFTLEYRSFGDCLNANTLPVYPVQGEFSIRLFPSSTSSNIKSSIVDFFNDEVYWKLLEKYHSDGNEYCIQQHLNITSTD